MVHAAGWGKGYLWWSAAVWIPLSGNVANLTNGTPLALDVPSFMGKQVNRTSGGGRSIGGSRSAEPDMEVAMPHGGRLGSRRSWAHGVGNC